jgi:8-oxo-dGTP diphosphatase
VTGDERTRVGAYAVVLDDSARILLCRLAPQITAAETWTLPGGGIDFGEAPRAAVLRELAEETGYDGEVVELVDVTDRLFSESSEFGRLHAIRIVYRVRLTGGTLRDEVDGSTDTCAWFALDAAGRLHLAELARRALKLVVADRASAAAPDPVL